MCNNTVARHVVRADFYGVTYVGHARVDVRKKEKKTKNVTFSRARPCTSAASTTRLRHDENIVNNVVCDSHSYGRRHRHRHGAASTIFRDVLSVTPILGARYLFRRERSFRDFNDDVGAGSPAKTPRNKRLYRKVVDNQR